MTENTTGNSKKPESHNANIQWPEPTAEVIPIKTQVGNPAEFAGPPLMPESQHQNVIPSGMSRRSVLTLGAAAIAAGVASVQFGSTPGAQAVGLKPAAEVSLTGTLKDVKHVVILMQENRSFDHYYGTLAGVRGFSDKQGLELPATASTKAGSVFAQPASNRKDGGVMLPFHMDSAKYNSQNAGGLDHSWGGGHNAWNKGAWNRWVDAKSNQTMGYFTRDDLPYHYSLADAFTIADHYFCSVTGPTTPNRLYQWSGTINPQGGKGSPATSNPRGLQRGVLLGNLWRGTGKGWSELADLRQW